MQKVAVIDYGMGNLHSVAKAVVHASSGLTGSSAAEVVIANSAEQIAAADRVVFPGVGAIRDCMAEIHKLGLDVAIKRAVENKPVLAICVGLQALLSESEENGGVACLGLIDGAVKRFPAGEDLKVPHMGWNAVDYGEKNHPLWTEIPNRSHFYFVHSYFVQPEELSVVAATTEYGENFASVLAKENLFAVQFHPEKSSKYGLRLLHNFLTWTV